MSSALSKLRLALGLALGFLLFRLVYAVVFTASSAGETLLKLPGIRLGGIFSHVVLFGPVGGQGLINSISTAIPFALAILAFGLASIWITPAKIGNLARHTKSGLLGALAIALATLPSLLDAAKRIATANQLRSEKRSQILIPLLETAIERAVIVGIRFATAARKTNPRTNSVVITELGAPGLFQNLSLELQPGDVLVVSGPTGVGKTTLLEALAGITQLKTGRELVGGVNVFGFDPALELAEVSGLVGYLPQQPRTWFLGDRVTSELAQPQLGWLSFEADDISHLSEGQAVKLAISNAVAHQPRLVLLDEPFAALDLAARAELNQLIQSWSNSGAIVVIVEHQLAAITVPAKFVVLGETLTEGRYEPEVFSAPRSIAVVSRELLLDYRVPKIRELQLPENLEIHQAQRIAILGKNGSGKTSLLTQLAKDFPGARLVPERVEDFFVCQSLEAELKRSDRIAKAPAGLTLLTLSSLIPISEQLLATHPRDLSAGSKLALAIAMQLSFKPLLLLIDEPVKGLDPLAREQASEVLACVAETGCAVVFATHDEHFASSAETQIQLQAVNR